MSFDRGTALASPRSSTQAHPDPKGDVDQHNQACPNQEPGPSVLVAKHLLSDDGAWPATQQLDQMKGLFGNAILVVGRGPLVEGIHEQRERLLST